MPEAPKEIPSLTVDLETLKKIWKEVPDENDWRGALLTVLIALRGRSLGLQKPSTQDQGSQKSVSEINDSEVERHILGPDLLRRL